MASSKQPAKSPLRVAQLMQAARLIRKRLRRERKVVPFLVNSEFNQEVRMQFQGKPSGHFRDDARWNGKRTSVEFTLDVRDDNGTHAVTCAVSWEALSDAVRSREHTDGARAIEYYESLKSRIYDAVDRKLKAGAFERDGSILIQTRDLNP
jgi:hypothetical protein